MHPLASSFTGRSKDLTPRFDSKSSSPADDPNETRNLAAEHPERVQELIARYEAHARQAALLLSGEEPRNFKPPPIWVESGGL